MLSLSKYRRGTIGLEFIIAGGFLLVCYLVMHPLVKAKDAQCSEADSGWISWRDTGYFSKEYKLNERKNTKAYLCRRFLTCSDDDINRWDGQVGIGGSRDSSRVQIIADGTGVISLVKSDSGSESPKIAKHLDTLLSGKYRVLPEFFGSTVHAFAKTDSSGKIDELSFEKIAYGDTNFVRDVKKSRDSLDHIGRRSPESILRVIRENINEFRLLYDNQLRTNPETTGKIKLKFMIAPSGRIVFIQRISSETKCDALDHKILEAAKKMVFDQIEYANTTVTYAFVLDKQ